MDGSEAHDAQKWRFLPHLLALAFAVRLIFALVTSTSHCPDEVFQYLEQAHRLVFGNGLIPWEYRFGVRSFMLPGAIALVLEVLRALGFGDPTVYIPVVKTLFCIVSISLIWSVYVVTRALANERAARLAAIFAAFWYELIYLAHKPSVDALSVYAWFAALAILMGRPTLARQLTFGALAAFAFVIRIQSGPLVGLLLLMAFARWPWRHAALPAAGAFLLVIIGAGFVDVLTWGDWFGSYVRYFQFNWGMGADNFFGSASIFYYPKTLVLSAMALSILGLVGLFLGGRRAWVLILGPIVTVAVYSIPGHKEHRFIFATIPFWLIGLAMLTVSIKTHLPSLLARVGVHLKGSAYRTYVSPAVIILVAVVSILGAVGALPFEDKVYAQAPLSRTDDLDAYVLLSDAPGVTGVYDESVDWWYSGGYYYLHKDVPLYFPVLLPNGFPGGDPEPYVSHWLRPASEGPPGPGYELWQTVGNTKIWRRKVDPPTPKVVEGYSRYTMDKLDVYLEEHGMRTW